MPPLTEPVADAITVPSDTVFVDDRARGRRLDGRVLEPLLGEVEVRCRADDGRLGVLEVERRGLELLRRDDARLEQLVAALLLLLGDLQLGLRAVELGFGLVVLVLHVARVDLDEQIARLHEGSRFDRHLRDEAGRLRLDLDDVDRLDDAGRLRVDDDVAARNERGLYKGRFIPIAAARGGTENGERQRENSLHERGLGWERTSRIIRGTGGSAEKQLRTVHSLQLWTASSHELLLPTGAPYR